MKNLSRGIRFPPADHHSTKFSIVIITRGRYTRPVGGRRAKWTQLDSTPPPPIELKKLSLFLSLFNDASSYVYAIGLCLRINVV
jgi:hypothetical protein